MRRSGSHGARQALRTAVVAPVAVLILCLALGGCDDGSVDRNEPNDEPGSATVLTPGVSAAGVIGRDDADVFTCEAPAGDEPHPFVVTVRTENPDDVELAVGAGIPGAWEGIVWPGWDAVDKGDRLELAGSLREGTVIVIVRGDAGAAYSVEIVWRGRGQAYDGPGATRAGGLDGGRRATGEDGVTA